uniref:Uncharacterized protein n=1 Tax=Vitis vinifera TaxID=29760 RepID=A5B4T8_VITVI|nr:hypothetical protein VITISV_015599 [Vitis vinifera]
MEQSRGDIEPEFNLREWARKARISRENTTSRRFSASNIRREDTRSFRSNITISSTASSPGYTLRGTSIFLISTPLAHLCFGALLLIETLSNQMRSTLQHTHSPVLSKSSFLCWLEAYYLSYITEKKMEGMTRDVGTQSTPPDRTPPDRSSSSPSPTSTPSIIERSLQRCRAEGGESPNSNAKLKSEEENELPFIKLEDCVGGVWIKNGEANPAPTHVQVEVKDTREKEETKRKEEEQIKKEKQMCRCRQGAVSKVEVTGSIHAPNNVQTSESVRLTMSEHQCTRLECLISGHGYLETNLILTILSLLCMPGNV